MRPSLIILAAPLVPGAIAGGRGGHDDYDDVPKDLSHVLDGKIEFCQNYLGWVAHKKTVVTNYHTKTKTTTIPSKKYTTVTVKKGKTVVHAPKEYVYETKTIKPHKPVIVKTTIVKGTKTFYDKEYTTTTTRTTTTIKKPGNGHGHWRRGGWGYDHKKGPDVRRWKKDHVAKACKKLLKHVNPKTRTYWQTKTDYEKVYTTATDYKTYWKTHYDTVPKYTVTYTPKVTKKTTLVLPSKTFTLKDYVKAKTTKTITKVSTATKVSTVYDKKGGHGGGHGGHKGGKDGKDGKGGKGDNKGGKYD